MEKDAEMHGEGNSYTTEFRQYDPRLGRWLSLDPLMASYPSMSPYVGFNDNPVYFTDPDGQDGVPYLEAYLNGFNNAFMSDMLYFGFNRGNAFSEYPNDLEAQKAYLEGQMAADLTTIFAGTIEVDAGIGGGGAAVVAASQVQFAPVSEPVALGLAVESGIAVIHGSTTIYKAQAGLKSSYAYYKVVNKKITAKNTASKAKKKNEDGIIYEGTDPKTGEKYIGQAINAKEYRNRQRAHNKRFGGKQDFVIKQRIKNPTKKKLDVAEETWIRKGGGPNNGKNNQGTLRNRRWQMNDKRYKDAGGKEPKPDIKPKNKSKQKPLKA